MASSPRFTFIVFMLGVFAGAVPLRSSQGQTYVESAQKEGEVVVYGANLNETMDPMHKAFEKKYGVAVKYWRGASTALATRATSEWRSGRPDFDVVQGNRGVQLIMAKEGLFIRHVTPSAEKFPAQFRDPDGLLSPMSFLPIGILYNRELVKGADVPKSFDDLLDPKWRGKVVNPRSGATCDRRAVHEKYGEAQRREVARLGQGLGRTKTAYGGVAGARSH